MRAGEILSLLVAYKGGIKPAAVRLYLASHLEAVEQSFTPTHTITLAGLARRATLADRTAQDALRELEASGLLALKEGTLTFGRGVIPEAEPYLADLKTSPDRPVPIPRRIMRVLARHGKASDLIGALVHLLRCLFINQGQINDTGFIKNELVTRLTGLSDRAIQRARNWMKNRGWIAVKSVNQRVLNRFGGCFSVNLNPHLEAESEAIIPTPEPSKYVELTPPPPVSLIYTNNNPQYVPQDQGDNPTPPSGVFKQTHKQPTLTDIKPEDLQIMPRLEALYRQAVVRKWLPDCEASIKNFVGAATRAMQVEGNPVKIFVGIVKKGLWRNITQAQEDISLQTLKRYRVQNPVAFTTSSREAFIPEEITPRIRLKPIRPERVIIRHGRPQSPIPEQPKPTPLSEIVYGILARASRGCL